jgi:hypothetical protein
LITVDFNLPLTVDRAGILPGLIGTNVDAFDVILDQSPEYPLYSGHVGSLIQMDSANAGRSASLTFRINQTKDGQPPRNVIIHIDGCNFATLATKAQVETRETTTVAGKLILQN